MNFGMLAPGCPLLVKELTALAARKRTYQVRALYAVLLFAASLAFFWADLDRRTDGDNNPLLILGSGGPMIQTLVYLQFSGIYLFLPAIACTALTAEKERDALSLLFLTRLGPWTILFEKLVSRLIPMFTFLLLSLPLMAFAYSYGGVSQRQIWGAVFMLSVTTVQVGALALMCSAFCRTTVGAFLLTYAIALAIFPGIPLLIDSFVTRLGEDVACAFLGPFVYDVTFSNTGAAIRWGTFGIRMIPLLGSTLIFLFAARRFLVTRAFLLPRHRLRNLLSALDGMFHRFNQNRVTRGVMLLDEGSSLPEIQPVAWRETQRRSLGRFRYLLRIFLAIELPVVAISISIIVSPGGAKSHMWSITAMMTCLWILIALFIAVQSSSLISGERSRQTLDVLLTTPLSGREIVQQKMQGLWRVVWILSACLGTVCLIKMLLLALVNSMGFQYGQLAYSPMRYLVGSVLAMAVYFPLIAWLSMWIGMTAKAATRAMFLSIFVIATWCTVPIIVGYFGVEYLSMGDTARYLTLLSPAGMIRLDESHVVLSVEHLDAHGWIILFINYAVYSMIVGFFRYKCLRHADRNLQRLEDSSIRDRRLLVEELQTVHPQSAL